MLSRGNYSTPGQSARQLGFYGEGGFHNLVLFWKTRVVRFGNNFHHTIVETWRARTLAKAKSLATQNSGAGAMRLRHAG